MESSVSRLFTLVALSRPNFKNHTFWCKPAAYYSIAQSLKEGSSLYLNWRHVNVAFISQPFTCHIPTTLLKKFNSNKNTKILFPSKSLFPFKGWILQADAPASEGNPRVEVISTGFDTFRYSALPNKRTIANKSTAALILNQLIIATVSVEKTACMGISALKNQCTGTIIRECLVLLHLKCIYILY